jgi:hypothetical protein
VARVGRRPGEADHGVVAGPWNQQLGPGPAPRSPGDLQAGLVAHPNRVQSPAPPQAGEQPEGGGKQHGQAVHGQRIPPKGPANAASAGPGSGPQIGDHYPAASTMERSR